MGEVKAKTTSIGSDKVCPLAQVLTEETRRVSHCRDDCEWNDGDGCAIWRLVKAAEHIVRDFQRSDSK
jgi:hypothetical protein